MLGPMMHGALRWIFWGILYLAIALMALVLAFGSMAPYLPQGLRWAIFGVFLYGIALDAKKKAGDQGSLKGRPPSGGDLAPSSARDR